MNKKKFILLALLLLCAYFYELFGGMPATVPFAPQPVKADTSLLLAPLDSRPPCNAMVRKLEHWLLSTLLHRRKNFLTIITHLLIKKNCLPG